MLLPKYKFYIGKALNFNITVDKTIEKTTGEYITVVNAVASDKIAVESNLIYFNYSTSKDVWDSQNRILAEYANVYMYDKNLAYLGYIVINESKICTLKDNTAYIAIDFIGYYNDIIDIHANFAKTGFSEVYSMQPIQPNYKTLTKKYAKESGQEFFRTSLDGKITLHGFDYEYVKQSSLDDTFIFLIEKQNTSTKSWYEYFKANFNKIDCKLDYEKKKCELKLTPLDDYNTILDNYENTYDLVKLTPEISKVNIFKRCVTQVYIRGANTISNFFSGTYLEDDVVEVIDSHDDLLNKYHFAYIKAGNEFYVKNAGIEAVNGVYAGINGYWSQWNGYTCYMGTETPGQDAYIYIKRNSDDTILYKSVKQWVFTEEGNCYIGREDIEMVNVNNSADKFTIESPFVYHIYQRLLCDVDSIEDSEGIKQTFDLPQDDFVTDNKNYKKCIGLSTGLFYCTSVTTNKPTIYGLNDFKMYFTDKFLPSASGLNRPLPICRNTWANASLWYVYDYSYEILEKQLRKKYTVKDCYFIADAIKALLNKVSPTIRHEATSEYSNFLYSQYMPVNADRFYLFITQKTNILKGQYDQAAQKAEISLKDITDMLRDCFRCYWYIENNKFKIEHILFFNNGGSYASKTNVQLDFTKKIDQFNDVHNHYFQSEIEYDKSDLNQRYEFDWMDDSTELFGNITIDVKAGYIQKGKKDDISISSFSSDIDLMLFDPSNFSNDGFALLCAVYNNSEYELPIVKSELIDENGNTYELISQNWYASWAYLASKFYTYDMPSTNVSMNALGQLYVYKTKKFTNHNIVFPIAEDLDELKFITTNFGNGKIDEYTVDLNTRVAKVKLIY